MKQKSMKPVKRWAVVDSNQALIDGPYKQKADARVMANVLSNRGARIARVLITEVKP